MASSQEIVRNSKHGALESDENVRSISFFVFLFFFSRRYLAIRSVSRRLKFVNII